MAVDLLGKLLVRSGEFGRISGLIVETEAYLASGDLASHSARGRTKSNQAMFGDAGIAYVYPIHAKYCFNVVSESAGSGAAILIRALQPVEGLEQIGLARSGQPASQWTNGPAKLCEALHVDRSLDGQSLITNKELWLEAIDEDKQKPIKVHVTRRIGISKSQDLALRFLVAGNSHVSGPRYQQLAEHALDSLESRVPLCCQSNEIV